MNFEPLVLRHKYWWALFVFKFSENRFPFCKAKWIQKKTENYRIKKNPKRCPSLDTRHICIPFIAILIWTIYVYIYKYKTQKYINLQIGKPTVNMKILIEPWNNLNQRNYSQDKNSFFSETIISNFARNWQICTYKFASICRAWNFWIAWGS